MRDKSDKRAHFSSEDTPSNHFNLFNTTVTTAETKMQIQVQNSNK